MLTVHFNGEIVRHPDHKAIQNRIKERYDFENRCKYGIQELACPAWVDHCKNNPEIKSISAHGKCTLSGGNLCPHYKKRIEAGNTKKTYKIDGKTYRLLASAAHYMLKSTTKKTLFLVLTFPKFKNDEITEQQANQCFSKFIENCRKTYGAEHYICTRERGEENNRLHFHLVITIPFVDFRILNSAWNHAISEYCYYSQSAIQSRRDNRVIKNPTRAIKYICKYISKSVGKKSDTRLYFISNETLKTLAVDPQTGEIVKISTVKKTIPAGKLSITEYLKQYKGIYIQTFEFVTIFRINDRQSFNKFCHNLLYPLFDMEQIWSEFVYNP